MNWTKKDTNNISTSKEILASRQLQEYNQPDNSTIDALCREIELLAQDSEELRVQYKSMIQYYQSLAGHVIAS